MHRISLDGKASDSLWLIREPNRFSDPFRFGRDREPVCPGPWRREKNCQVATRESGACYLQNKSHVDDFGHRIAGKKKWQQISGYHIKRPAYLLRWYMSPTGNWRKSSECKKRTAILLLHHRLLPVTCLFRPFMPSELLSKSEADSSELLFCWVELQSGNQPAPTKQDVSGHYSERTYKHGTAMLVHPAMLMCSFWLSSAENRFRWSFAAPQIRTAWEVFATCSPNGLQIVTRERTQVFSVQGKFDQCAKMIQDGPASAWASVDVAYTEASWNFHETS